MGDQVITFAWSVHCTKLAATTAMVPTLNSQTAQAVLDGVILGSSAWPSVPVDARGRLQLVFVTCEEEGRCKRASDGIDD